LNYWEYHIRCTEDIAEILLAFLSDSPFTTFAEDDSGIKAYMPQSGDADEQQADELLKELAGQFEFEWEKVVVPAQNWNALWESNFTPVVVDGFCGVRAEFHAPLENVQHELVIQPKMAFGSGHHETTWMCMKAMEQLPIQNTHLYDYGCGTGILAILASRLGAQSIEAVDIEEEAWRNTEENATRNGVANVEAYCGTLDDVRGSAFDGILANINRNVILASLPRLQELLKPGAWLLISGFILDDESILLDAAKENQLHHQQTWKKGNWLCMRFNK
jgi:ribosomal protein L11 methyltransferase